MFSDNFDRFANIKIFTNCVERKLFIDKFVHNISENVLLKYNTVCIKKNLKEGGGAQVYTTNENIWTNITR